MFEGKNRYYLEDQSLEIEGLNFYGSPWQPDFCNWAFNLPRGQPLADKWAMIPDNTDVLITHGPPHMILDQLENGERVGDEDLQQEVTRRVKPGLHVFGHIHSGYGRMSKG